eukprot:tig00000870_g5154.t1
MAAPGRGATPRLAALATCFIAVLLASSVAPARAALDADLLSDLESTLQESASRSLNFDSDPYDCTACGNSFGVIDFAGRKIMTSGGLRSDKPADVAIKTWNVNETSTFFIHLRNVNPNTMNTIQRIIGYPLTDYIPDNTFLFTAKGQLATDLVTAGIQGLFVGRLVAGLKLSDALNLAAASTTAPDRRGLRGTALDTGFTSVPSTLLISIAPPERSEVEMSGITSVWVDKMKSIFGPTQREGLSTTIVDRKSVFLNLPKSTSPDQLNSVLSKVLVTDYNVAYVDRRPQFGPPRPQTQTQTARQLLNENSAGVVQTGTVGQTAIWKRGLTGANQLIGIGDSGIDWDNCYFQDKSGTTVPPPFWVDSSSKPDLNAPKIALYIPYSSKSYRGAAVQARGDTLSEGHGTHVAGSAAGNGLRDGYGRGMAYDAKIVFSDFGPTEDQYGPVPGDLTFPTAYAAGARIHSNSWGCYNPNPAVDPAACNTYSGDARKVDAFVWENPDFLVLFAAGNDGQYPGETLGSPATCKNCLAVGAISATTGLMAKFSSRGYGVTDRIKPDLVAPGSQIESARSDGNTGSNNCDTKRMSGTSMATPIAAGAAALVRQYLTEGWYPSGAKKEGDAIASPPAALIRAMMIASTTHVSCCKNDGSNAPLSLPPNKDEGFGSLNLANILRFEDSSFSLYMDYNRALAHRNSAGYCFTVGNKLPLTVTLAWTDAPGSTTSVAPLVNDLDLQVWEFGPGAWHPYYPNTPDFDYGTQRADRMNNVEKIVLQKPNKDIFYYVSVRAFNIPVPKVVGSVSGQDYALVVKGDNVKLTTGCPTPPDLGVLSTVDENSYPSPPARETTGHSIVPRIWVDRAFAQQDLSASTVTSISKNVAAGLEIPATRVKVILIGNYIKDRTTGEVRGWVFLDIRLAAASEFQATLDALRTFLQGNALAGIYKMMPNGLSVNSTAPLEWRVDPNQIFSGVNSVSSGQGVASPSAGSYSSSSGSGSSSSSGSSTSPGRMGASIGATTGSSSSSSAATPTARPGLSPLALAAAALAALLGNLLLHRAPTRAC